MYPTSLFLLKSTHFYCFVIFSSFHSFYFCFYFHLHFHVYFRFPLIFISIFIFYLHFSFFIIYFSFFISVLFIYIQYQPSGRNRHGSVLRIFRFIIGIDRIRNEVSTRGRNKVNVTKRDTMT